MNGLDQALQARFAPPRARPARATRLALELLDSLHGGALAVELPQGEALCAGSGPVVAQLKVHDEHCFSETLARGDIGFGESYIDGLWDSDRLAALLGLLSRNRAQLGAAIYGKVLRLAGQRLLHLVRSNTRRGARRNIHAHYDLGNRFYALWLDPTMSYSAAIFAHPEEPLHTAQLRKYRRILQQLDARPGQTILEIGCGWGGFAEVAATEFGCRVRGVTLSPAQRDWASARAAHGGYAGRVNFELTDYRDLVEPADHIVSIEMIEAVGERYWPTYFTRLARLLKPGGRCVLQAITIADALFPRYRRGTDFIQRHVFPGGMLPCPAKIRHHADAAGLALSDDFAFGADYARTLARWSTAFETALDVVRAQGFDERFVRMWRFYLAYCEAGFISGDIDVHQYTLAHTGAHAGGRA
jgi:cyclopropane-fatty-acyl-phospholipid synthase